MFIGVAFTLIMISVLFLLGELVFAANTTMGKQLLLHAASYGDAHEHDLWTLLIGRLKLQPFNIISTVLFVCAILHTFFTHKLTATAHRLEEQYRLKQQNEEMREVDFHFDTSLAVDRSFPAEILYFLGEVESVFLIWVIPLVITMTYFFGWDTAVEYVEGCDFNAPVFVVVIMIVAASRPIVNFAERGLEVIASIGGRTPAAWWMTILSIGPLLSSLITEPAAMTLCAVLLIKQFYRYHPKPSLAYSTIGLLFVNVSVGGTLTHFAAPPVLMVSKAWGWDTPFMLFHFGWKAVVGILLSNIVYYWIFREEFKKLIASRSIHYADDRGAARPPVPFWITLSHLVLLTWIVSMGQYTAMFLGAFLLYLAFYQATAPHQNHLSLRGPVLVGCFLAGLVIHGSLQEWWLSIVLGRVGQGALMLIGIILTSFNDNAAITYLATLVPNLTLGMKLAVVAGAVAGGGLTVIANAPNPAGYSLLVKYFRDGISPMWLFIAALIPTIIISCCLAFL